MALLQDELDFQDISAFEREIEEELAEDLWEDVLAGTVEVMLPSH